MIEDCKPLADYYEGLVDKISQCSLLLQNDGELLPSPELRGETLRGFKRKSGEIIREFLRRQTEQHRVDLQTDDWDTVIFPTVQMGVFNIQQVRADRAELVFCY